jgi:hypothetical protein
VNQWRTQATATHGRNCFGRRLDNRGFDALANRVIRRRDYAAADFFKDPVYTLPS